MSSRAKTSNKIKAINFLKKMTISAFMMGLSIVFARFISIYIPLGGMPSMRFSLGNLPTIITSLVCGPIWGMVVGAGADLIGATAFPVGAYFFGYTIDSAIIGLIPWVISKNLNGKKRIEFIYSIVLNVVSLIIAVTYLYTHTSYSNGKTNFKYELILDDGIRLGITFGLIALSMVSFIVILLLAKFIGKEKYISRNELPRYELFRGKKVCVNPDALKAKEGYSFIDIYSFYITSALLVSICLLPYWNSLTMSLPYFYGVFNNLIFMWIEAPIKIIIYWMVLNILKKSGYMHISGFDGGKSYSTNE